MDKFFESKQLNIVLVCLLGIAILSFVFHAGVEVGYHKASFSYHLGDKYHETFGERTPFTNSHGAIGSVVSIVAPNIIVAGEDGVEKNIITTDTTVIHNMRDTVTLADLKTGDHIIVFGMPADDGTITAAYIRLLSK